VVRCTLLPRELGAKIFWCCRDDRLSKNTCLSLGVMAIKQPSCCAAQKHMGEMKGYRFLEVIIEVEKAMLCFILILACPIGSKQSHRSSTPE
jgi:hypothetical protein